MQQDQRAPNNIFGPWKELGNPCVSKDSLTTYYSQSTYILPVQGIKDAYIFMADRWKPENPIEGKYIWLPLKDNKRTRMERKMGFKYFLIIKFSTSQIQWKDTYSLNQKYNLLSFQLFLSFPNEFRSHQFKYSSRTG